MPSTTFDPRAAHVGDLVPPSLVARRGLRRIDAVAIVIPGAESIDTYTRGLAERTADFAAWDGRVQVLEPDGRPAHRLLIVDRYGQVYAIHDATDADGLPDADALEEWFRFLATACPECGVLDEPVMSGPTL